MARIVMKFDQEKAVEAILYLSKRVSESEIYGICKLLYLVDKTSLERYGRFVFGESYVAMKEGATPFKAYDMLKKARRKPIDGLKVEGNQIIALREANMDCLSKSDVECLNQIIESFGKAPYLARREAAHDAAWEKAWNERGISGSSRMPIENIAAIFPCSTELIDYLSNCA